MYIRLHTLLNADNLRESGRFYREVRKSIWTRLEALIMSEETHLCKRQKMEGYDIVIQCTIVVLQAQDIRGLFNREGFSLE